MQRPAATVVMPVWNAWTSTSACLAALKPTLRADDQVVIVDNGSRDETSMFLPDNDWLEIISNPTNRGFAAACNQGAAASRRSVVVFLHNDTLPPPNWLESLLAPLSDPTVGAVGPRTNAGSGPQVVGDPAYTPATVDAALNYSRRWHWDHLGQRSEVDFLKGFCLAVRTEAFNGVGGFDTTFGTGGHEDVDLSLRLQERGWKLLMANDLFLHHFGRVSYKANKREWKSAERQSFRQLVEKYPRLADRQNEVADVPPARPAGNTQQVDVRPALPELGPQLFGRATSLAPVSISIVLPTHNRLGRLHRALASVADQTVTARGIGVEVVVVNDGGLDVRAVLQEFDGRLDLQLIEQPHNAGPAAARNLGVSHARGELLGFLDDDDILFPHHLDTCLRALREEQAQVQPLGVEQLAVHSYCIRVNEDELGLVARRTVVGDEAFRPERLAVVNSIPINCVLLPTDLVRQAGGFDESMQVFEDWELWLRLVRGGLRFHSVPVPTTEFTSHRGNTTIRFSRRLHETLLDLYRRYPEPRGSRTDKARVKTAASAAHEVQEVSNDMSVVVAADATTDPSDVVRTLQSAAQVLSGSDWELVLVVPDLSRFSSIFHRLDGKLQFFGFDGPEDEAWAFGAERAAGKHLLLVRAGEYIDSELVVRALFTEHGDGFRVGTRIPSIPPAVAPPKPAPVRDETEDEDDEVEDAIFAARF